MGTVEEKLGKILEKLEMLDTLERKMDTINVSFGKEIEDIKSEIDAIKQKCLTTERSNSEKERKCNLLFFGVQGKTFFTMNKEIIDILKCLVPEIDGNYINDLWKTNKKKEKSPVVVKLNSMVIRNLILRKKHALQGDDRFKHIQIKEDLSREVRATRKLLFPHLIKLKEEGRKVIMVNDKLKVDSQLLSLEDL
ncbi:hypothetical protein LSTR_LSTR005911 [Laodelphax striatellus]|uniref:Uncharacterized protein n=1 Tax=Laodelphax striatellus TaxID=195883 RepID=A0A482WGY9_LAOST|nr:hypothetical protein LSTR_LSTR005911 [Laodelphax striatellus]